MGKRKDPEDGGSKEAKHKKAKHSSSKKHKKEPKDKSRSKHRSSEAEGVQRPECCPDSGSA
jgi:hypothetical protein